MREEDAVAAHHLVPNTHDTLLFFTDRGRVFSIKAYELPDAGRTAKGVPIINLISILPDEIDHDAPAGGQLRQRAVPVHVHPQRHGQDARR